MVGGTVEGVLLSSVISSNVAAYGYNEETEELYVQFKDGSVYKYYDVPEDVWALFQTAPSKGRFVWQMLRDVFPYERIL